MGPVRLLYPRFFPLPSFYLFDVSRFFCANNIFICEAMLCSRLLATMKSMSLQVNVGIMEKKSLVFVLIVSIEARCWCIGFSYRCVLLYMPVRSSIQFTIFYMRLPFNSIVIHFLLFICRPRRIFIYFIRHLLYVTFIPRFVCSSYGFRFSFPLYAMPPFHFANDSQRLSFRIPFNMGNFLCFYCVWGLELCTIIVCHILYYCLHLLCVCVFCCIVVRYTWSY